MRNIRLVIEYDGTNFFGWQYQPHKRTVQGEIEEALKKITAEDVKIIGAGRTDQGVHALGQVANFHTNSFLKAQHIKRGVNSLTGGEIYVREVDEVDGAFNSRYSTKSKLYRYHITRKPSPFKVRYHWYVKYRLDVSAMEKVIPHIVGERDFKNFAVSDGESNTVCTISNVNLTQNGSEIILNIEGNRFLRKMVRGIVGFMIDVGRGRFSYQATEGVLVGKIKNVFFAPPQGLFLVEIKY
ncbi:MAG: tRNA pseudouridine(38-40) synthase TruA [candidate division WOR-3 bacterium]|nr:MAG: tRNA pseudouridine(38-40) synthase TruA [candidate division WOR-3 bacterium]